MRLIGKTNQKLNYRKQNNFRQSHETYPVGNLVDRSSGDAREFPAAVVLVVDVVGDVLEEEIQRLISDELNSALCHCLP